MPLDSRDRQILNRAQLETTLKAVAYRTPGPINREDALQDITLETPKAEGGDLPFKLKAVSLHWEMMFTRSLFGTPDMAEQGKLLNEVAALVDAGRIRSTATEVAGKIDAATLRAVHARIESGSARGKIVLEGF